MLKLKLTFSKSISETNVNSYQQEGPDDITRDNEKSGGGDWDKESNSKQDVEARVKKTYGRTIKEVVHRVHIWRSLYEGKKDENGVFHQYTLEQAAAMVEIPLKSLNDYLLKIR